MVEYGDIAGMIDHSLLNPTLTTSQVIDGCKLADRYRVASVCVRPCDVKLAVGELADSQVSVTTVVGFPHGTTSTHGKLAEARTAIEQGAVELDVVQNIGRFLSGDFDYVRDELRKIVEVAHSKGVKVKVILENCYLSKDQIRKAAEICNEVKADWIKTSTGYGTGGALDEDLEIMVSAAAAGVQVKAAGGVRTLERATRVREIGCTRFGASATKAILDELRK